MNTMESYKAALQTRNNAVADYQAHINKVSALESEVDQLTKHLALLNESLNRATDVETGLATQQSIGAANERLGLLQTVLRNLKNKVSGFHDATLTAEKKLQLAYRAVFQAEYDRIADSIRPELHELSAVAATLMPDGATSCPAMNLKGAFPFLKETKEGAFEKISARLGLPVKIPKAAPVVGV